MALLLQILGFPQLQMTWKHARKLDRKATTAVVDPIRPSDTCDLWAKKR